MDCFHHLLTPFYRGPDAIVGRLQNRVGDKLLSINAISAWLGIDAGRS